MTPDLASIAASLVDQGVSPEVVSATLSVPLSSLRSHRRTFLTPEDEQLANAMRQIAWRAWAYAMDVFDNGHPDAKMTLMRTILGRTANLVGQESTTTFEDSRDAVNRIFTTMRDVDSSFSPLPELPIPEADNPDDPPTTPTFKRAYDPGQEPEVDEDPLRPQAELDRW